MKIVSWNVHRCIGTDGGYRPDRIAEALASFNADIIALQEVDSSLRADDGKDQLSYIASRLGMQAEMGPTLALDYGAYGNAVLSRWPLIAREEHDLSYRKFEPRGALAVVLGSPMGRLRVVNTHLGLKYWERAFQIDRVLSELVWVGDDLTILLGDFNEWFPFSGNSFRLKRAFRQSPRLATFPAPWPQFALDRIFCSRSPNQISITAPRNSLTRVASDHLPLIADISL